MYVYCSRCLMFKLVYLYVNWQNFSQKKTQNKFCVVLEAPQEKRTNKRKFLNLF